MSKPLTRQERLIRIELARTRAELERQNISRCVHELHDTMTPAGLWQMVFARSSTGRRASRRYTGLLMQALTLTRRYPFLLGTASAALSRLVRGRRKWWWGIGLAGLAGWKLLQGSSDPQDLHGSSDPHDRQSPS